MPPRSARGSRRWVTVCWWSEAETLVRVHVHTEAPEEVFAYARTLGAVSHEKTEDMEAQFQAVAAKTPASAALAVVAVGAGEGIDALFRSLGAAAVVSGGQTMNPSAGDIRAAIGASGGEQVIVLPNNKNIVLAAQQAAAAFNGRVCVVETRSIPQGVAALVAMNPEGSVDENVEAMTEAIAAVTSGEVTLAARATTLGRRRRLRKGNRLRSSTTSLRSRATRWRTPCARASGRMLEGREGCDCDAVRG